MKITIQIDCDTISEFYSHLTKLREDVKKQTKKLKLDPLEDEFPKTVELDDSNCYGEHYVKVSPFVYKNPTPYQAVYGK